MKSRIWPFLFHVSLIWAFLTWLDIIFGFPYSGENLQIALIGTLVCRVLELEEQAKK